MAIQTRGIRRRSGVLYVGTDPQTTSVVIGDETDDVEIPGFAGTPGPTGPEGPQGPQGPQGDPGTGTTYQRVVYVVGTGGQSNDAYWGTTASSTDAARLYYSDPRIGVWGGFSGDSYAGQRTLLALPRQTVDRTGNVAGRTGYGLGYGIARAILKHTANPLAEVLIVDCAIGDTSITETGAPTWRVASSDLTANMIARVNAALASDPDAQLHSLHWCQGERNANLGTSAGAYITALDAVFAALRAGITGASTTPLLIYEMVPYWQLNPSSSSYSTSTTVAAIQAISTGHTSAQNRTDGAYAAFVPGPTGIGATNATETVHYNAASCFSLGESGIATYMAVAQANTPGSVTLPLAPTVSVVPTGSGTATVTITPAGGSQDGYYTVEVQANGAGSWTLISNTGALLSIPLTGQADGLRNCRVRAFNRAGQSVSYGTTSWVQAPIPSAPVLSLGTISTTSIGLSCTTATGGTIDDYEWSYEPTASPGYQVFADGTGTGTTTTITGLTNAVQYNLRVRAHNTEYGWGPYSNVVTATTGSVPTISGQAWRLPTYATPRLRGVWSLSGGSAAAVTFGQRAAGSGGSYTSVTPSSADSAGFVLPIDAAAADVEVQIVGANTVTLTWLAVPQPFYQPDFDNMTVNGSNQVTNIPSLGTSSTAATQANTTRAFTRDTTTVSGKTIVAHTINQGMDMAALPTGAYLVIWLGRMTSTSGYKNIYSSGTSGNMALWFDGFNHGASLNTYAAHAAPTNAVGPSSVAITLSTWRLIGFLYAGGGGTLTLYIDNTAVGSATVAERSGTGTKNQWNMYNDLFTSPGAGCAGQSGNLIVYSGWTGVTGSHVTQMGEAARNELGVTLG
jgi:hypothetical protein